MAAILKIIFRP